MAATQQLETELVPIESLKPYPGNARRHDLPTIRESLRRNGQYRAIVARKGTREILAGHGTVEGARAEGWTEIAVTFVEVDDETARRIVLVDNRANDLASYDDSALAALLGDAMPDLYGTGWDEVSVQALLASGPTREGEDTAPKDPPTKPQSRLGDIYLLGEHRLICGDSTDSATLERLLDGDRADLVYTDPPYGMSYSSQKLGGIKGDDLRGVKLRALVRDALSVARSNAAPGAATYVWCTWRTYPEFCFAVAGAGLEASGCIVWRKGRIGPGSAHYRPEHEFCLYCRPDEPNDHDLCIYCKGLTWEAGRGESDVWELPRDSGAYLHPTQKPTPLAERALNNSTRPGAIVLDVFGGSGSTLIAAENLNRHARLVELDPAYVDVIVDRWERHTGKDAERQRA